MKEKGYDVVPVNPRAEELEGVRCYPSVKELPAAVDGVLVMLPPAQAADVVRDCPHMFLGGGFPHNIHRFFTRLEA